MDFESEQLKLHKKINNGKSAKCPMCGQNCKIYRRKITSGMAYALCYMHIQRFTHPNGVELSVMLRNHSGFHNYISDVPKLRFWGLIEPVCDESGALIVGWWKITELGSKFVEMEFNVPKYVFIYNNDKMGASDEKIDIMGALSDKFSYKQIFKNTSLQGKLL